jgi:gas vesicle protein
MSEANKSTSFTSDEQKRIETEVKTYQEKAREAEVESEIRNRILDAQRELPGYRYH